MISPLRRIGPAFIVGACIIGPGSVTLMSKTGAQYGYSMLWLAILTGALMAGFIALFMRWGIYVDHTVMGLVAERLTRPVAALGGIVLASSNVAFQFGNNLGVSAAMELVVPDIDIRLWPVFFTAASIVFMFGLKHIYRAVEGLMTVFLVLMFLAFLANLVLARPDLISIVRGSFVPQLPPGDEGVDWITIGGLVATTFILVAALFQSYLVKAKGWTAENLPSATLDTVLASVIYTLIGCVIMATAATVIYPDGTITSAADMASQLEKLFGPAAQMVFAVGFGAAAFSSFLTNALVGGVLLCDGFGLGGQLESKATKVLAALILVVGMLTAIAILQQERQAAAAPSTASDEATEKPAGSQLKVQAIAVGQATTLLAVPLGAIVTILVLFDRRANANRPLPLPAKLFAIAGLLVLLSTAAVTYEKLFGG